MLNNNDEDRLYQYTSLDVLALILKNKNIKLSKLSTLDDPLEKYVEGIVFMDNLISRGTIELGEYCFVSSWSKDPEESIAMWDMYGNRKKGVRISLPEDMIDKNYDIFHEDNEIKDNYQLIPVPDEHKNLPFPELKAIDYSRLESKHPSINANGIDLNLDALGMYKLPDWSFQEEKRFRLLASIHRDQNTNVEMKYFYKFSEPNNTKGFAFEKPLASNYIFFGLKEEALHQIEIVIGPEMTEGDRLLLDALARQYDIKNIHDSKFTSPDIKEKLKKYTYLWNDM